MPDITSVVVRYIISQCYKIYYLTATNLQKDGENPALNDPNSSVYDFQEHHPLAKYHHGGHLLIGTHDTIYTQ